MKFVVAFITNYYGPSVCVFPTHCTGPLVNHDRWQKAFIACSFSQTRTKFDGNKDSGSKRLILHLEMLFHLQGVKVLQDQRAHPTVGACRAFSRKEVHQYICFALPEANMLLGLVIPATPSWPEGMARKLGPYDFGGRRRTDLAIMIHSLRSTAVVVNAKLEFHVCSNIRPIFVSVRDAMPQINRGVKGRAGNSLVLLLLFFKLNLGANVETDRPD